MKKITVLLAAFICSMQLFGQATFHVSAGTTITACNNAWIVLENMDLINNGTFKQGTGNGNIKFVGNKESYLSGTGVTFFDRLVIEKEPYSQLLLQTSLNIIRQVNFSGGRLNLGNNILDLGNRGVLTGESETSNAFTEGNGYIQVVNYLNNPSRTNTGNLGAVISSSSNLGNTIIRRGHITLMYAGAKRNSIHRYYDIIPANNSNLNATVQFNYFDTEVGNSDESTLSLWKITDDNSWINSGYDKRSSTANYVEKTGINGFTRYTLSPFADITKTAALVQNTNSLVKDDFFAWPNPVFDKTTVRINANRSEQISLFLYDAKGSLILKKETTLRPGINQLEVNTNNLSPGTYILLAKWGITSKTTKLNKM